MSLLKKVNAVLIITILIVAGCDQPNDVQQQKQKKDPALQKKAQEIENRDGKPVDGQFIVVYNEGNKKMTASEVSDQTSAVMSDYQIQSNDLKSRYRYSVKGFAAQLNDQQVEKLKNDDRVKYVEQDRIVQLSPPHATQSFWCIYFGIGCTTGGGGAQSTPYGITRVGGSVNGSGDVAWIIDTGIDLDHEDLNVDTQRSATFAYGTSSPDDGNGHGTHVSGTIAAKDNDVDVVGVDAGATVVAVRVLNSNGSGYNSDVISGIDYVAQNASPGDVANMSLGGGTSQAVDNAVLNAASNGIYFAIAAGNDSENANNSSPARVNDPNVWTVSAIDSNDNFASFSNYGNPPVDFAGPGVDVKSLWKNNGTNTISGTSMATPHVAGVLLATGGNPSSDGTAYGDPDGNPDPIVHE